MVSLKLGLRDNRKKELEEQEWYHGFRSRKDVSVLIREPGDFLLRATDSTNFTTIVISVMNEKKDIHHLTIIYANSLWQLGVLKDKGKTAPGFKTIVELVNHYKKSPLPTKVCLKRAIIRPIWMIKHDHVSYEQKDLLGTGNFCNVYKGFYTRHGDARSVAIKICHEGNKNDSNLDEGKDARKAMISEAQIMSFYVHNHVIQFYGLACDHPPVLIVMEFCPGGSLEKLLKQEGSNIIIGEKLLYALEAARGMRYLHSQNCIHRDLAARNCLISSDGKIKISDFGLSRIVGETDVDIDSGSPNTQIPLRWMAPESLRRPMKFSTKTDVWAFGVLLYEIFNDGIRPWSDDNNWPPKKIATHIRKCLMPSPPEQMDKDMLELLNSIWILDADNRPSMAAICIKLLNMKKDYAAPPHDKLIINKIEGVCRPQSTVEDTADNDDDNLKETKQKSDGSVDTEATQKLSIRK